MIEPFESEEVRKFLLDATDFYSVTKPTSSKTSRSDAYRRYAEWCDAVTPLAKPKLYEILSLFTGSKDGSSYPFDLKP
jgi:hypothetical protein